MRQPTPRDDRLGKLEALQAELGESARRLEEAERRARRAEALLRGVVDSHLVGVLVFRPDGAVVEANEEALRILGRSREDLRSGRVDLAVPTCAEHRHKDERALAEVRERGACAPFEKELERPDGTRVAVTAFAAALDGRQGERVGVVVDETERRRAEAERERLRAGLEAALRARDDFISIAAHELRTPVTSLKLRVHTARRAVARGDPGLAAVPLEAAVRQVDRLARLIEALLDVSRARAGRLTLGFEDGDLAAVAREVALRFVEDLETAGCRLVVRVDAPVPARFDRTRIEQVATNLLSNALRHGARPGTTVEVEAWTEGGRAMLAVRDQGPGIAPADRVQIFDRHDRAGPPNGGAGPTPPRPGGGLGLGLWIAREIVAAHGGSISVASKPGKGATFTVVLPAAP